MMLGIRLLRNPLFMIGTLFILGLFFTSLGYYFFKNDEIPVIYFLFDENGEPIKHPYKPTDYFPFGTDHFGRDILYLMLIGTKYTLGIAFAVALLRLLISSTLGIFFGMFFGKMKKWVASIADAVNYFPATLLAYFSLIWVLLYERFYEGGYSLSFSKQFFIIVIVFTAIAIPTISALVMNETDRIMKKEFMEGVRVLGASKWQMIRKHLMPYLLPQFFMIFLRELIQVLLLLAHLGLLRIFLGGLGITKDMYDTSREYSISNEWSGLLGSWWEFIWAGHPQITAVPVLFFTLTILAAKMALMGFEQEYNRLSVAPKIIQRSNERSNTILTKKDFKPITVDFKRKRSANE
ncbi:ABC transporter permease [Pseudalkalibacillus berkeleyi]|uniref:ABC transporter permease subunit n=1 Tax=Pseudalkalibacillus berkeleyi TaxID=1069813 RepID=A0ABS9GXY4_9BACL|nr:ABC transporter permease subunit [Pseudalkalibacillus berkeleyi]MCF6136475.1 ABC transporter permease subunit [Pseudalkalibacillus berkeleyi]